MALSVGEVPDVSRFPFHQGRFQGCPNAQYSAGVLSQFPFHQGRFQGRIAAIAGSEFMRFPFHQGRFQGREFFRFAQVVDSRFHSTKEGFKGASGLGLFCAVTGVSIPPRKVSRGHDGGRRDCAGYQVSIPPRKVSRDFWA